jgi:hypothetical protein
MLSTTLNLTEDATHKDIGKQPLVVNLLQGMYNSRPPTPKYSHTWDPRIVLAHFEVTALADPSLIQLSRKVVTLLALTTMLRCSDIGSIQARSLSISDSQAVFSLGRPRKSQHSGKLHHVRVEAWAQNQIICLVKSLEMYIAKTSPLRTLSNAELLFIGTTKPHKPVSSSTVGRWIKEQLKQAGVDTSVFSAHSTRGASDSKAVAAGIPIQTILKQGHWARESTFAKFYQRDCSETNSIEAAVLNSLYNGGLSS